MVTLHASRQAKERSFSTRAPAQPILSSEMNIYTFHPQIHILTVSKPVQITSHSPCMVVLGTTLIKSLLTKQGFSKWGVRYRYDMRPQEGTKGSPATDC